MNAPDVMSIRKAVVAAMPLAEELFTILRRSTTAGAGVSRESYGPGEQIAHDLAAQFAREHGMDCAIDPAGNLYLTLRGRGYSPFCCSCSRSFPQAVLRNSRST